MVKIEINNKIIELEENQAIELASIETFKGNKVKINNKSFDIMKFAKSELKNKLAMAN